jgi:hypothetical protein
MSRWLSRFKWLAALVCVALSAELAYAQFGGRGGLRSGSGFLRGEQGDPPEIPGDYRPDGFLAACHWYYTSVRREANGAGWRTDYPWAGRNLLLRLSELTKTRVSWLQPHVVHSWLTELDDDALFQCPYLMASDVGTIGMTQDEADRLRLYLEKGGFLWVDDFWGEAAWAQWTREFGKAMPPDIYPIEDIPLTDPIFTATMLEVKEIPQVPSIRFWRGTGGNTSERGEESATVHIRGIRDKHGRIIAIMTHNTDLSDSFEREGEDPQFFSRMSSRGYPVGIDILLYILTH